MNKYLRFVLLGISLFFTSCIPVKDLVYLQRNNEIAADGAITEVMRKPYRLQINDVLSITIKADDPKLVTIFNTTDTAETEKTGSSLYFEIGRASCRERVF